MSINLIFAPDIVLIAMADIEHITAKAIEKREQREKKRVRFTGDDDSDEEEPSGPKLARFPKGKKAKETSTGMELEEEEGGGLKLTADPRIAVKERAVKRRDPVLANDDTGMLDDVVDAEEDFQAQDPDEVNVMEPFNLKKEREEGFFDPEGNYVEYVEKDFQDPWLESTEVDESLAKKAAARAAIANEPQPDLSAQEMAAVKRRIANALEPGETVLQGLRRLGGTGRREGGKKGSIVGKGGRMPDDKKEQFDRLTEDAMKLMDAGEYGVYSELKETFEREAAGYEALVRARSGPPEGGGNMFADSDEEEEPVIPIANGSNGAGKSGLPDSEGPSTRREVTETLEHSNEQRRDVQDASGGQLPSTGPSEETQSGAPSNDSGYVFDPSTGYYYNSDIGYYYDSTSGLFCSASTGLWYRFVESTNTYEEVTGG